MAPRIRNRIRVLNTEIDNLTLKELLENLKSGTVFTPNVDHLINLRKDKDFRAAYSIADYRLCDGQILFFAARFLGKPIKEKISGSDFFPAFYQHHHNNRNIKIFLLGAAEGVAHKAQILINRKVGREMVVGSYSPSWGFEKNAAECRAIIDMIHNSGATVLAVGLGSPKQEKWLYQYRDQLKNIKIFMAIGATIDFEAGHKSRAPRWMSNIGLEFLYRILQEPRRLWKRYLVDDLPFLWLVLKEKLAGENSLD